jgi:hypothetical protein
MIGNSDPHEPGYTCGPHTCTIDWKDEATKLMQMVCIRIKIINKRIEVHERILRFELQESLHVASVLII